MRFITHSLEHVITSKVIIVLLFTILFSLLSLFHVTEEKKHNPYIATVIISSPISNIFQVELDSHLK